MAKLNSSRIYGNLIVDNTITGNGSGLTALNASNISSGTLSLDRIPTITIAKGGTNITTYAAGDILYASATNVLSKLAKGTDGQVLKLASGFPAWGTDNNSGGTVTSVSAGTQISGMGMTITNGTTTPSIATSITNAANFRTAIGAGTGNGTVTSVGLSLPNIFTVTNSPVTETGTLTGTLANQSANIVFAGPSTGSAATPTFRSLVVADIPLLNQNTTGSAGSVTNAVTFNNSGSGAASGTTYNGSTARTISYNTIGAQVAGNYLTAHPTITLTTDTTSTASPAFGGTFTAIDSVTRDGNGHVTTLNTKTVTLPANPNTDTLNTAGSNNSTSKLFLVGPTSQTTGSSGLQTFSNSTVYTTNGTLFAPTFAGGEASGGNLTIRSTSHATKGTITLDSAVTISGDLTINGTTTTLNSTTLTIDDKNIELGSVASPTDTTANGGGITLKGTTDKTITWDSTNSNWTLSEHLNIQTGKLFKINNTEVLSLTALGTGVTGSSLTSVGTIGTGTWQGTIISPTYGGTGVNNGARTLTVSSNNFTVNSVSAARTLTLNRSFTFSGDNDRTLTINNADKTLAGAATALTFAGNFTTTGAFTTTLAQGASVTLTLPTTNSTLATTANIGNGTLNLGVSGVGLSGSATFTANQSTASTFTVTSNATSANTANAIVSRDGSGNFSAGNITLTGDIAVNGGDITTTATTFKIGNTATTSHTTDISTAATASGQTKTINIGTGGVAGSLTNVNIGSLNDIVERAFTLTEGSSVITGTNTANIVVGQSISGDGIPNDTVVFSIVANTSVTMRNGTNTSIESLATESGSQTLIFGGTKVTIAGALDVIGNTNLRGKLTVEKDADFKANVNINGSLNVKESITAGSINSNLSAVQDNKLFLRVGATEALGANEFAGLVAINADGTNDAALLFDGNGNIRVGDLGAEIDYPMSDIASVGSITLPTAISTITSLGYLSQTPDSNARITTTPEFTNASIIFNTFNNRYYTFFNQVIVEGNIVYLWELAGSTASTILTPPLTLAYYKDTTSDQFFKKIGENTQGTLVRYSNGDPVYLYTSSNLNKFNTSNNTWNSEVAFPKVGIRTTKATSSPGITLTRLSQRAVASGTSSSLIATISGNTTTANIVTGDLINITGSSNSALNGSWLINQVLTSFTRTASINGTTTVSNVSTFRLVPGMSVSGTGIPANSVVRTIVNESSFTLGIDTNATTAVNATTTGSQTLTFGGNNQFTFNINIPINQSVSLQTAVTSPTITHESYVDLTNDLYKEESPDGTRPLTTRLESDQMTNTGLIYWNGGTGEKRIETANNFYYKNNRIGLNTSNPSADLHVAGSMRSNSLVTESLTTNIIYSAGGIVSGGSGTQTFRIETSPTQMVFKSGLGIVRTFNTTNASSTISNGNTVGFVVGQFITGSGIPANTTISSITSGTDLVMSAAATTTATAVSLTFTERSVMTLDSAGNATISGAFGGNINAADITTGTLAVARGGTGQTTLALARNAMGLGNTTGALPVANGGTNATSVAQGGIIYGASTSAYASTAAGTAGQVLQSNGTSAPTWVTPSSGVTNLGITNGTTAGPIVTSSTGTNATLPLASTSISGVLSTAAQTLGGEKTFANGIGAGSGTQTWQIESGTSNLLFRSGSTPTTRLTVSDAGLVTATTFSGSGASLTSLPAGQLTGTIPSAVLGNSSLFIGTTSVALNRASATLALTGVTNTNWDAAYTHSQVTTGAVHGATTVGNSFFRLANPGAITFPRMNADNTVTALNAADFRTAIGAGTSSTTGTVTSVAAGAGLNFTTFTTSGTVAMGTPSTLTTSTSNSASGTTHTHAITTTTTGANSTIVATDSSGTITASTFNATSLTDGGFQGIAEDSATQPSHTWTGDLDTGMYRVGADQLGFTAGGTGRLTVSASQAYVIPTTASTSTSTGALRVGGGVGIGGALFGITSNFNTGAGSPTITANNSFASTSLLTAVLGTTASAGNGALGTFRPMSGVDRRAGVYGLAGNFNATTTYAGFFDGRASVVNNAIFSSSTALTLTEEHAARTIFMTSTSAIGITIPADASNITYPVGTQINIFRAGTGEVTINTTNVTLRSEGSKRRINAQYQGVTLVKYGGNEWYLIGALKT